MFLLSGLLAEATPSIPTGMNSYTFVIPFWLSWVFSGGVLLAVIFFGRQSMLFSQISTEFPKMRRALDLISEKLVDRKFFTNPVYVSAGSPLHLTPEGKAMLEQSGFEEFFTANKERIYREIDKLEPTSPFDVEAATKHVMLLHVDLQEFAAIERIKQYAYENGVQLSDMLFAFSIEVRNRYLAEHQTAVPA